MSNLTFANLSAFASQLAPMLQACTSAIPTVIGVVGGIWATSIRRTAKDRFDQGVGRASNDLFSINAKEIELQQQRLRALSENEDDLIRRINARAEAYAKHLESRIETQSSEISDLTDRVRLLEIENRNMVRENLAQTKYTNTLVEQLVSLGQTIPDRTREFDV